MRGDQVVMLRVILMLIAMWSIAIWAMVIAQKKGQIIYVFVVNLAVTIFLIWSEVVIMKGQ